MNWRQRTVLIVATGGGVGKIPFAPGTAGSLLALLPCLLLSGLSPAIAGALILAFTGCAVGVAHAAENILNKRDPGCIVIDEMAGMMVTLAGLPFNILTAVAGFIVFRTLDIIKPFPIRSVERRLGGGTGVVMDDVIAGIMGNLFLRILLLWPSLAALSAAQ